MSILTASCKTIRVNECYKCIELPTIGLECPGLRALYSQPSSEPAVSDGRGADARRFPITRQGLRKRGL